MLENRSASTNCIFAVAITADAVDAHGEGVFNKVWCVTLKQHATKIVVQFELCYLSFMFQYLLFTQQQLLIQSCEMLAENC